MWVNLNILLGKIRSHIQKSSKFRNTSLLENINIEWLPQPSIRKLYKKRIKGIIENNGEEHVNAIWEKLKANIKETATRSLGTRNTNRKNTSYRKIPWFYAEV